MRINANTTITGGKVVLVPYRREHVSRYHEWMQCPQLQELTASEPLTLAEEYEMQAKWAEDEDKVTFILLDTGREPSEEQQQWPVGGRAGAMAGDVNAFVNDHEDRHHAEIEIMVAEPDSRRKGIALEALRLFMAYLHRELGITRFTAKIGEANTPSLTLFEQQLGFKDVRRVKVFEEVHLELKVEGEVAERLRAAGEQLQLGTYDG